MNKKLLTEPFEMKGRWWMPENESQKLNGYLRYDPFIGVELDLFGSLNSVKDRNSLDFNAEIILGEMPNGKPVTLLNCYESNVSRSVYALTRSEGFPETKIKVQCVFEGQHFQSEEDIKFQKLNFELPYFEEWAERVKVSPSSEGRTHTIAHTLPPEIKVSIPNIGDITLFYGISVSQHAERSILSNSFVVSVESTKMLSFREWWDVVYLLRVFFSLATRRSVYPLYLTEIKPVILETPDGSEWDTYLQTDIIFKIPNLTRNNTQKPLFVLTDVKENIETCFVNWFQKAEDLKPIYDLYFGTLDNPTMYSIHRFLSLAQALETYDRSVNNDDIYLRDRVKRVWKKYLDIVGSPIQKDIEDFAQNFVDTRNYLTHYNPNKKDKALNKTDRVRFSDKLQTLIEMCLLVEIGISENRIKVILQREH